MNKLSQKFIAGMVLILVAAGSCVILFNEGFLETYYLTQKKTSLHAVCAALSDQIQREKSVDKAIASIEKSSKVIIAKIDGSADMSGDEVNDEIRAAFLNKGIGFQKYWLWEEDLKKILHGESRVRLYQQEKLNYSLLVEYSYVDTELYAVTMIIPDISDAFGIINSFLIAVNIGAVLIMILFIVILVRRITKPLQQFEDFAVRMGDGVFNPLKIHTGDELERVADNLNTMGNQVIAYQESLNEKNRQMEQLLDDVAHDLKTPVSLIQLYGEGMKDGLDDGTFLDTMLQQSTQMEQMINRLLFLSRIDMESGVSKSCDITELVQQLLNGYALLAAEQKLDIVKKLEDGIVITTNEEWIETIFSNLMTNAIKYAAGSEIEINLHKNTQGILFIVSNETDNAKLDTTKIWNLYYVGETSRNKHLSGTGLGLAIVKKLSLRLGYDITCTVEASRITFTLRIPI